VLGPESESQGTYQSDVFDARIFSRWGRADFRGTGNVDLYARSGNVDNPDRNWSAWKKIDSARKRAQPKFRQPAMPSGRRCCVQERRPPASTAWP